MHMMCVIGVYVTDPAHNIIFGGKCPALFGRSFILVLFVVLCLFHLGRRFPCFSASGSFRSTFFEFVFRMLLWSASGAHFFKMLARLKIVGFFSVFYKRLKSRVSLERCRKNCVSTFFSGF